MTAQSDLDYRTESLELKVLPSGDNQDTFEFEGIATTFGNIDRTGDIISTGAFDEGLRNITPKLLWQHNRDEPIGRVEILPDRSQSIKFKGFMPTSDTFVRDRVMPQLRIGSLDVSIGFRVDEQRFRDDDRIIEKGTIFEISLVSIPANPLAVVTDVKSIVPYQDLSLADAGRSWDSEAAIGRIRDFFDLDENADSEYRKAFLWFDGDADENFGSYKLPIADVIDGRLTAVPRAIFASAAAMQGARGGVNIPDGERPGVIRNIEKYYNKMNRESPFEKGFSPDEIRSMRYGQLVKFMRTEPLLSKNCAEFVASKINGGAESLPENMADDLRYLNTTLSNLKKDHQSCHKKIHKNLRNSQTT